MAADMKTTLALAAAVDAKSKGDFRWLIEAPGPRYLYVMHVPSSFYEFRWTQDHNVALAFRDKKQADDMMMAVRQLVPDLFSFERTLTNARPVEHGWIDAAPAKI